jgi:mannose-6-phosphate isomerase-like protein (cupin superfamily)
MAIRGKEIKNDKTGQRIKFIQTTADTQGSFLDMIATYERKSLEPPTHYHPHQEEYFEIISGELTVRMNGELEVLGAGHQLYIAKNTSHAMWNDNLQPAVIRWKVVPALETERLLETVTGLANEGKTGPDGKPGLLQTALTAQRFRRVIRLDKPPYFLQRILFSLLTPIAYVFGYDAECKCEDCKEKSQLRAGL